MPTIVGIDGDLSWMDDKPERDPSTIRNGRYPDGRLAPGQQIIGQLGRPGVWESPDQMIEVYNEYVSWTISNPVKTYEFVGSKAIKCENPKMRGTTIYGFCRYCNTIPNTFFVYASKAAFKDACSYIQNSCTANNLEGAMANALNPVLVARLEGISDKREIKTELTQKVVLYVPKSPELEAGDQDLIEGEDWSMI